MSERAAKKIRELQQKSFNSQCFVCYARGTNYVLLPDPAVFVCNTCAGLCREVAADCGFRVMGISMSNFTDEQAAKLESFGNKKGRAVYWPYFSSSLDKLPKDAEGLRTLINVLLVKKRWHVDNPHNKGQTPTNPDALGGAGGGADDVGEC